MLDRKTAAMWTGKFLLDERKSRLPMTRNRQHDWVHSRSDIEQWQNGNATTWREESLLQIVHVWISAQYLNHQGFVTLCAAVALVTFDQRILIGSDGLAAEKQRTNQENASSYCFLYHDDLLSDRWIGWCRAVGGWGYACANPKRNRVRKTLQWYPVQQYTLYDGEG